MMWETTKTVWGQVTDLETSCNIPQIHTTYSTTPRTKCLICQLPARRTCREDYSHREGKLKLENTIEYWMPKPLNKQTFRWIIHSKINKTICELTHVTLYLFCVLSFNLFTDLNNLIMCCCIRTWYRASPSSSSKTYHHRIY